MDSIDWGTIVVAALAGYGAGALYYLTTGRFWVAAQGRTKEEVRASAGRATPHVVAFLGNFVIATMMLGLLEHLKFQPLTAYVGLITGITCWLGFVATTLAVNNSFQGKSPWLSVIDAGHWAVVFAVQGSALGALATGHSA